MRTQPTIVADPVPRLSVGAAPMSTLLEPFRDTAWPETPAVHPAPLLSVPVSCAGALSAAVVPVPSLKCQEPVAASALAVASSIAVGKTRTSSIAPCQKSEAAPEYLPRPTTKCPVAFQAAGAVTVCCLTP